MNSKPIIVIATFVSYSLPRPASRSVRWSTPRIRAAPPRRSAVEPEDRRRRLLCRQCCASGRSPGGAAAPPGSRPPPLPHWSSLLEPPGPQAAPTSPYRSRLSVCRRRQLNMNIQPVSFTAIDVFWFYVFTELFSCFIFTVSCSEGQVCVLRFAPGRFWWEGEVSFGHQLLLLELFAHRRGQPLATVCQCPAGTPPDPKGTTHKQSSVHQQTSLQNNNTKWILSVSFSFVSCLRSD